MLCGHIGDLQQLPACVMMEGSCKHVKICPLCNWTWECGHCNKDRVEPLNPLLTEELAEILKAGL